jgi:GTP-binding protein LepA
MAQQLTRNFSIIAHIDHGKSTLADRFLEVTGTVRPEEMREQYLDQMDLERERGITIKGKAVRMDYRHQDGQCYRLNLIDTPGHVDFSYEVSRALAACEGAILVVDASQGIEAQTLANVMLAMENDLVLVPVVNKIDLPQAEPDRVASEMQQVFGFRQEEILFASAKSGIGVQEILNAVIDRVPPPNGGCDEPLRAMVFDSEYNSYKGIVAYVRVFDGSVSSADPLLVMSTHRTTDPVEIGIFSRHPIATGVLETGDVGYIATGLKDVKECAVGETLTQARNPAADPLPGYKLLKPMVYAGIYPAEGEDYQTLRTALERLQLNDAALVFQPESSPALGFGVRCGFLGLLHMDIVQERLEREYELNIIATAPSVACRVALNDGSFLEVESPSKLPDAGQMNEIFEPWLAVTIIVPHRGIGSVMELMSERRGEFKRMDYIEGTSHTQSSLDLVAPRVVMEYGLPLSELLIGFYDELKSRTQGYGSLDYSFDGYRAASLVKLEILLNHQAVDALCSIIHKSKAHEYGKALVARLSRIIPRQQFEVPIQAAIGSHIIARETVRAVRKDVLAKCYGGDVTRKRKLLEAQKEGKKRLKRLGNVEIPQEAFLALVQVDSGHN